MRFGTSAGLVLCTAALTLVGCGDDASSDGSTGGAPTGGSGGASSGGMNTGGTATGGMATGGSSMGGSGQGGGGNCEDNSACQAIAAAFTPCGGDPQGTWNMVNACSYEVDDDVDPQCPNAVLGGGINGASGTAVIDATTISYNNYSLDGYYHTETPLSCIMPLTCADYEAQITAQGAMGCCEVVNDVCICDAYATQAIGSISASYTVNGSTITIEGTDSDFCVQGTTMTLRTDGGTPDESITVFELQ